MGERSSISWTGPTWNPWQGCRKVSPGCKYCYMYRDKERYGQDPTKVHRSSRATFDAPLKWQRQAERGDRVGQDRLVFTCSWSDWFIEEADGPWRDDAWAIIKACPLLTFQVLTKRIGRAKDLDLFPADWGDGYPNVWGGVSVEDRAMAIERVPLLIHTRWKLRFLSAEPLLGLLNLDDLSRTPGAGDDVTEEDDACGPPLGGLGGIDWVVVGGESGNDSGRYQARPCNLDWISDVVRDCKDAAVPVHVKQLGTHPYIVRYNEDSTTDCGEEVRFHLKDHHGGDWSEWPEYLRVREIPEASRCD